LFAYVSSLSILAKEDADKSSGSSNSNSKGGTGSPQHHRARILIVDDEEDVTFFLKEALEEYAGFEVVAFNDPLLALSSFDSENTDKEARGSRTYDLILLDIKMPKMDGFELYQELQKKIDDNGKTKVCFMTAFEVYYEALKELFPDSYPSVCFIKKPFSAQDLINRITKEMSRS
jgi:DNA-binding response OmpR family regulator